MVNYSIRSVYNKEYFELYSEKRNRSFRFARYNGNSYEELCKYIHEVSPNTEIWEEYKMTKNSFYTYSGRTYQFNEVPLWEMRCCIASNPFLLLDGERIPLTLSQSEAEEYLRLSDKNTVFCYDDLCVNYMYNSESCEYLLIDRNHPKGISSANLTTIKNGILVLMTIFKNYLIHVLLSTNLTSILFILNMVCARKRIK